jgi:hypothetical protein
VSSWKSQFANIVHSRRHHPPSQPTISAQLLGEPAAGEPYTILIMSDSSNILVPNKILSFSSGLCSPYTLILKGGRTVGPIAEKNPKPE